MADAERREGQEQAELQDANLQGIEAAGDAAEDQQVKPPEAMPERIFRKQAKVAETGDVDSATVNNI